MKKQLIFFVCLKRNKQSKQTIWWKTNLFIIIFHFIATNQSIVVLSSYARSSGRFVLGPTTCPIVLVGSFVLQHIRHIAFQTEQLWPASAWATMRRLHVSLSGGWSHRSLSRPDCHGAVLSSAAFVLFTFIRSFDFSDSDRVFRLSFIRLRNSGTQALSVWATGNSICVSLARQVEKATPVETSCFRLPSIYLSIPSGRAFFHLNRHRKRCSLSSSSTASCLLFSQIVRFPFFVRWSYS